MAVAPLILALAAGAAGRLCDGVPYDAFDFWLGNWAIRQTVHQPDGKAETYAGSTHVTRSADGCTITEHWRGRTRLFWYGMTEAEDMWGYSVRRVDPSSGSWLISWIDSKNPRFGPPFEGGFEGSSGTFYQDGGERRGRIRFVRNQDGSVHWDLAVAPTGSDSWRLLWEMEMSPADANSP